MVVWPSDQARSLTSAGCAAAAPPAVAAGGGGGNLHDRNGERNGDFLRGDPGDRCREHNTDQGQHQGLPSSVKSHALTSPPEWSNCILLPPHSRGPNPRIIGEGLEAIAAYT